MSFGLPSNLAVRAASDSLLRALHAVALTSLAGALLVALIFQLQHPTSTIWPAMIAVIPMAAMLVLYRRPRSPTFVIACFAIGGTATFWYLLTFFAASPSIVSGESFALSLPKIGLFLVIASGLGYGMRLAWCVVGYLAAETATAAAALVTRRWLDFDTATFLAFVVTVIVLGLAMLSQRRFRRSRPMLYRVARDEQVAAIRDRMEVKATALMHDTVLSHLAAIANSTDDALSPTLRAMIERDLDTLVGEEWLLDPGPAISAREKRGWKESGLYDAIEEVRALGLDVEPTGDLSSLSLLDHASSIALGRAAKQCLVNVLRHSGTTHAEVVAYGTTDEVTVMVIDGGRGFAVSEVDGSRLGLRTSVVNRMKAVGGAVQVWSTPGRGTSVLIRVPTATIRVDGRSPTPSGGTDPSEMVAPS